ncbi:DNA-formamidopyrimidine glycosylase family protein [Kocuria sp.]|uniref:DNA-formamidopyrimidine glycosylase family protein n=1 Tax=Kocuria sp. TaxID=1871328 RepID=UPI0026E09475|nr:DNA-formamidopyrimidine glycosylase family protein [Kocuria sp.]MDO5366787.1 DNA-formamidopyrimidine glycosylase family protein [Kocuria sp.]
MPEGDSVYRQCKMLREALKGQVLASSDLRVPALATTDLSGRTVVDVVPRGKHILIRLSAAPNASELKSGAEPLTLHSHLMMDGTWRVFERAVAAQDGAERESGARAASSAGTAPAVRGRRGRQPYRRSASVRSRAEARTPLSADVSIGQGSHTIRAILRTATVDAIGFDVKDVRLVPTRLEDQELVGFLGPDILGPDWNLDEALRRLRAQPDRAIGTALMDQRNLAGIGNVYRVEVLFMTRTNPWAPVGSLPEGKLTEIVTLAHKLLNLNRDRPLRSTVGHPATGRPLFWAYGHYDQPCRRCGARLKRGEIDDAAPSTTEARGASAVQHLRQIAWCPTCQSGGA